MVFKIVTNEFAKLDRFDELFAIKGLLESEALSESGLSKAVYDYIRSLGVASVAEMTFMQKLKLTTLALKEQAVAFLSSPLGMATAFVAGMYLLVKVAEWFQKSADRAREKLIGLKEEFDEISSTISSAKDEIDSISDKIDELNSKESPTFTDHEELENLRAQRIELERTVKLLEYEQQLKQRDVYKSFVDTMNKDLNQADKLITVSGGTRSYYGTETEYIEQQLQGYYKKLGSALLSSIFPQAALSPNRPKRSGIDIARLDCCCLWMSMTYHDLQKKRRLCC